jgi:hypothetical protein
MADVAPELVSDETLATVWDVLVSPPPVGAPEPPPLRFASSPRPGDPLTRWGAAGVWPGCAAARPTDETRDAVRVGAGLVAVVVVGTATANGTLGAVGDPVPNAVDGLPAEAVEDPFAEAGRCGGGAIVIVRGGAAAMVGVRSARSPPDTTPMTEMKAAATPATRAPEIALPRR